MVSANFTAHLLHAEEVTASFFLPEKVLTKWTKAQVEHNTDSRAHFYSVFLITDGHNLVENSV